MKKIPQDIIGSIAILKFGPRVPLLIRKHRARRFLKTHPSVTTVLEKTGKFSGRLRTHTLRHLAGEKTTTTLYRENDCVFCFDVAKSYFSSRLSSERAQLSEAVFKAVAKRKNPRILVMFAGVGPFPIVIGRSFKKKKRTVTIVASEINRHAVSEMKENVRRNSLQEYVGVVGGDSGKISSKVSGKFDVIIMPRANLKRTFLDSALSVAKKGTVIFYYGFGEKEAVKKEIQRDAGKEIGRVVIQKAGNIAPGKYRWRARFSVR